MNGSQMYGTLANLVDKLAGTFLSGTDVIRWGAPVPAFGDPSIARVATLGLNPSNREFVNDAGRELGGSARRFHTLGSLGIRSWKEADSRHLQLVLQSCLRYFEHNPYDRWFGKLDRVLEKAGASFYMSETNRIGCRSIPACHLDLIPYATRTKWMELKPAQRLRLLEHSGDALGAVLRDSSIRILVLNGQSVVDHFEALTNIRLNREEQEGWALPRQVGAPVRGISYRGVVQTIHGVDLSRNLLVLGYNHNLQSSFGVTKSALEGIANWIGDTSLEWRE